FFSYMYSLTEDKIHKERIAEFCDPNNLDDLWDYTTRPKRTLVEVLQEFNTVKVDFGTILNGGFPIIHPRLFSIASSASEAPLPECSQNGLGKIPDIIDQAQSLDPNPSISESPPRSRNIKLIVAILSYKTIIAKPRRGLSTTYLANLTP